MKRLTMEEICAIDARWSVGGFFCKDPDSAKLILEAATDACALAGYAKVLLAENDRLRERLRRERDWADSELTMNNEIGMKNLQQLIQVTNEVKELRATVEHLHTILGKKEYELQRLREKLAPLLPQETECT